MRENDILSVLDAALEIDRAKDVDSVVARLQGFLGQYGLTACLVTNLPNPSDGRWYEKVIFNGWPADWYQRYISRRHYRFDPCVERCRNAAHPFVWNTIDQAALAPPARQVMAEAAELGLRDGICIPIHNRIQGPAVVTAAGLSPELSPLNTQFITALAMEAFQTVSRMARNGTDGRVQLSKRECEILQWTAVGKTAWEISCILGLSEHTVATHLRNVRQKLDTANMVQTVVEALRRRLISF